MDIVGLQEPRLPGSGYVREKDFSFVWLDKPRKYDLAGRLFVQVLERPGRYHSNYP